MNTFLIYRYPMVFLGLPGFISSGGHLNLTLQKLRREAVKKKPRGRFVAEDVLLRSLVPATVKRLLAEFVLVGSGIADDLDDFRKLGLDVSSGRVLETQDSFPVVRKHLFSNLPAATAAQKGIGVLSIAILGQSLKVVGC